MKTVERFLIKTIIAQFIFLMIAQWVITHQDWAYHLNRVYEYEGIMTEQRGETVETIDRSNILWYDEISEK
ncbi:YpfB family protein [Alkalihalobacillus sp. AL-G]|uniref:YpfB family protein n=1 Tax=Alkalihalobacillus sp. AL-G TaxID=2926399 RepID=UPI00272C0491|nr:YpfB family protein [Alkalihalobacillus sp. AL-G]WLD91846.1 YpfB family protein [Alkalihalobacillus sp. AL-G]